MHVHPGFTPGSPQVDPACFQRLKHKHDQLLSNFAFNSNLRPFIEKRADLLANLVGRCRLTLGWKQLTPRLLSGTFSS